MDGSDFNWARLVSGIGHPKEQNRLWIRRHGLLDDTGRPLNLVLLRLRKTHKAEWYEKTQGQLEQFAVGHTVQVAATHYADMGYSLDAGCPKILWLRAARVA